MEGFRSTPYRCPGGSWTIGWGHNIDSGGCKISKQVAEIILEEDIHRAALEYISFGWNLNPVRKNVVINMIFWHGLAGFMKFEKMLHAIEYGQWDKAADEMMDSLSGRNYPTRMQELADLMRDG